MKMTELKNVSDKLADHEAEVLAEIASIKTELKVQNAGVVETVKSLSKQDVANILEKNYKDVTREKMQKDHGRAMIVQAALTHLGYNPGEINGVY